MNANKYKSKGNAKIFLNLLSDPAAIVDTKGRCLMVNDAFEEISGLKQREIIGKPFTTRLLTAESKTIFLENLKKQMHGVPVEPYETCFACKTGETRCVEIKGKRIIYAEQPANLLVFHDITRAKENVELLKEYSERVKTLVEKKVRKIRDSEEKFRAISTCANDAIVVAESKGKVIYWNPAAERIFGYTQKEAIGKNALNMVVPTRHQSFNQIFLNITQNNRLIQERPIESTAIKKDKTKLPIELTIAVMKIKNELCLLGIIRDISERKKAEYALRRSEAKYRELINGMHDAVFVIDFDAHFVDVNAAAVKILGYSRKELLSMGPADIDSNLSREQIQKLAKEMPNDQIQIFETTHTTKNGKKIPVEISSGLVNYHGKHAILSVARNIVERKHMQNELAKYSARLEHLVEERTEQLKQTQAKLLQSERMAAIGELAGMIGHDLRNPLTGIKSAVYYLQVKQGKFSDDKCREMLKAINSAIAHADKIIGDLQEYSKEMRLEIMKCSPRSILQQALIIAQVPSRIKITDNTRDEHLVEADKVKMERVFINIIKNAVDAMPEGGTLQVTSTQINGTIEISFIDTGIGMTKETLAKVFLPLVTTKAQGMGFGLAVCKRIVEAHQGRIKVQSVEGKGTTVTIIIPTENTPKDEKEQIWINVPEHVLTTTKA